MKKRCFALLLALILCLQLAPSVAAKSATEGEIKLNLKNVVGGSATLTLPDGSTATPEINYSIKKSPKYNAECALTATATPEEGYDFSGWTIGMRGTETQSWNNTNGQKAVAPETGGTIKLTTNPVKFVLKTNQYYQITPSFSKCIAITLASSSEDKGSVTCTENDLNSFLPGGELVLEAKPKEGCDLTGWSVTYADGTAVPETAAKVTSDLKDNNKATLTTTASLSKDITVTATFVDGNEPHFVLFGQVPDAQLRDAEGKPLGVKGTVSGWSNDLSEPIVITFKPSAPVSLQDCKTTIGYMVQDKWIIPEKVTFTINGKTGTPGTYQHNSFWEWNDLSSSYEVGFTVSDGRNHVKSGVIRYELSNRALVQLTSTAGLKQQSARMTYNNTEYAHGDTIDFDADASTITISASESAAATANALRFCKWEIGGVTLKDPTANPITFEKPPEFFTIKALYSTARTLSVSNTNDAHGKAYIQSGDSKVESVLLVRDGKPATVIAEADEGYEFVKWDVAMVNGSRLTPAANFNQTKAWTTLTAEGQLYQEKLEIGIRSFNVCLTPTFDVAVSAIPITVDHSNCAEGTVTPADTAPIEVKANRQSLNLTAVPAEGYNFIGWSVTYTGSGETAAETDYILTETGTGTATFAPTDAAEKAMTVKAQFKAFENVTATITVEHGSIQYNGTTYATGSDITFPDNRATVELTVVPDAGYGFYGWEISSNDTTQKSSDVKLSLKLPQAAFAIKAICAKSLQSYQVLNGDKDITSSSDAWDYGNGVKVSPIMLATYSADITFDEAVSNSAVREYIYVPRVLPKGTKVLIAVECVLGVQKQFVLDSITLNGTKKTDEKTVDGVLYYTFDMPDQDVSVVLHVHEKANVQIHAVPDDSTHGTVTLTPTGAAGGSYYKEGTTLSLTAVAASGYRFKEWKEAAGSSYISAENKTNSTLQFTVGTVGATITAIFEEAEKINVPVTYIVDPEGKAKILVNEETPVATATEGTVLNISLADLDEYFLFDHWEITNSKNESLILDETRTNSSIELTVPNDAGGITIKAVLKARKIYLSSNITLNGTGDTSIGVFQVSVNGQPVRLPAEVQKGDTISYTFALNDSNSQVLDKVSFVVPGSPYHVLKDISDYSGTYTITDWMSEGAEIKTITIWAVAVTKNADNTRYSIALTQPSTGGTIQASNQTAKVDATITLTAIPASGYALKTWTVTSSNNESVTVTPDSSNASRATFTMPAADVTVTAEFEKAEVVLPAISNVQLLRNPDKTPLADDVTLDEETATWTITLPSDTDQTVLDNLTMQYLKITHSGASVSQMRGTDAGHDDATLEPKWSSGNVMCNMELNTPATFTVTAADGVTKKIYTIKIVHEGADKPVLSNGSANRISDKTATVTFTSSAAGSYYYKVVTSGAAEPDIDTSKSGSAAVAGSNTITLNNLTAGARDIYIVVKAADGTSSDMLKIEIPAFGAEEDGQYTIKYAGPEGGTVIPNKAKANAGETITLTIVPDNGKQMKAGTLTYTIAVTNGETVSITGTSFVMPENNVTISCKWEDATTPGGDTTIGGITAFTIDGVAGVVDNTTNTISVVMAYGTDVTKLIPIISGNNIASISPASGQMVDFTNSVRYTVTLTDGTVKYYTVTVYVQEGTAADKMWDKLTDFYDQTPWWEYADHQVSTGHYPKYW